MQGKRKLRGPGAGLLLAMAAATGATGAASAREKVDLLLYDANVLTVDRDFSIRSAVAVRDERIVAVGGPELRKRYRATRELDLGGRTLMPGFTDTHLHSMSVAPSDIDVASARSVAEVQAMLRRKAAELGAGKWITGRDWQEANFAENRNLTRADLDAASPDNPVFLIRAGGHSAVSNSVALKLAGIDRTTPDPEHGLIEHTPDGEPNGIIRERTDLVRRLIPQPSWDEMRPGYITWLRSVLAMGVTTFFNAWGSFDDEPLDRGGVANPAPTLTFRRAREIYALMGDSLPRMVMYINYPGVERLQAFGHHTGYGDKYVKLGPIGENPVDGGFTGPTAWLLADYKGQPGFRGKGRYTDTELQEMVDSAARLGWQIGLHCIGDAAIVQTVNAYDKALNAIPPVDHAAGDRRWFTDHFTIMPPDSTMRRMRKDDILISQQPNFLYALEDRYRQTLDDWRLEHNNPVATPVHDYGLFVAFGSDNLPSGPMTGLYVAITRKGPSGRVIGAGEAVSRREAIRMYTANGPYFSWEEKEKGTLEAGKLADMVVLPFDPMTADPQVILDGKVDMTFLGGKLVYERKERSGSGKGRAVR